ncbi:MAG TPA: peptidase [Thermoanaerobaculia bacterium]|nr:peptidase [Thermoanaerobaculia bacterium]
MKRLALALSLVAIAACQKTETAPATSSAAQPQARAAGGLDIAADTPQRLAQLPRTTIDYDRSLLNANEQQVVAKLIDAAKAIDDIYYRQVSEENPKMRDDLAANAGKSALNQAGYDYFVVNKGPWDRLKDDEPFIGHKKKPAGAAFYPEDMTKDELEKYVAAHPDQKEAMQGLFTVIRRDGANLKAIPYSQEYKAQLDVAAKALRDAAGLTTDNSLKTYLTKLADALGKDNYRDSDMAWMDLNGDLEVILGPYEVYEDNLFNYKASFESFINVVDKGESAKLAAYAQHLPDMEKNLPEPEQYKNTTRGTSSPIKVVQELYTAGDARRGVQTSAFNLPNDEYVREKKGSKKVLLKNVMEAKFKQSGAPIAQRVLDPALTSKVSFDAYFNHTLFHELSHGLGPGYLKQANGERVEVRIPLKNLYSAIEECKADVLGLWNIRYAIDKKWLTSFDEQQLYVTYAGLMFRSMRFGIGEAHGRGTAVQWNWIREKGGVTPGANGKYTVDIAKFRDAVQSLATELLTIEATGDFSRGNTLLTNYGKSTPEMEKVIAGLKDIPVDITPVYPAAGEK